MLWRAMGLTWLNYTSKLKHKDMLPIPWMMAMALQSGWLASALTHHLEQAQPDARYSSVQHCRTKAVPTQNFSA